jgi:vacuolar protein sorting-associated protein 26
MEDISGTVEVIIPSGSTVEHNGLRIDLIGVIECKGSESSQFLTLTRELIPAGNLSSDNTGKFEFKKAEKQFETYNGVTCKVKYMVKATLSRNYMQSISKDRELVVHQVSEEEEETDPTPKTLEVGIEDCLHINFEYNKDRFHLRDCLIGKVKFVDVKIRLKCMEIALMRKESIGSGSKTVSETETITK